MSKTKKSPLPLRILLITLSIIAAAAAAFFICAADHYSADSTAQAMLLSDENVTVKDTDGSLIFLPADEPAAGFIFYQGAKVEPAAYAPLMHSLAEKGVLCAAVKMPFNFAFFDLNAADAVIEKYPHIKSWYIGGHSLGGSMAAEYVSHRDGIEGLVLLASFSTADISENGTKVLSVYGTEDGVLDLDSYRKYYKNLPPDTREIIIDGGNHAGFGSYGAQKGDGTASVSSAEQTKLTAEAIAEFISE